MSDMIEVARATVTIIPNMEGSQATIAKDLGAATEPAANSAGKKAGSSFASSMGGAISAAAAVTTAAVGAAAAGVTAITKSAVDSFADYEQLSGGIETLFGESADAVMSHADQAFKTAGLSVNEYMDVAISSAASMINSVGGDVEKAASLTDQAITDMSDNVNKMGTSMEGVQNAYRGFSRGNFTMLDNLALGFAGTKEGMQELLDSAKEISGVDYDINSYADIVEAIHVVQTEMGITGTTAKEASETISGSVGAMKSSWENLLAGLANPSADIDGLVNDLVSSAETVLTNVIPVVERVVASLPSVIEVAVPAVMDALMSIIETLLPEIPGMLQQIMDAVIQVLPQLLTSLLGILPDLIACIANLIVMLASNLSEIIMPLVDAIPTIIPALISGLITALPAIIQGLLTLVTNIVAQLPTIIQALVDAMPTIIEQLVPALIACVPQLIMGAVQLVVALVAALPQIIQSLLTAIPTVIEALINAVATAWPGFVEAVKGFFTETIPAVVEWGLDVQNKAREAIVGLVTKVGTALGQLPGKIKSALAKAITAVVSWGTSMTMKGNAIANKLVTTIVTKVKELPGKMLDIGKNIVEGLWNGIKNMTNWLTNKLKEWCNGALDTIKGFFGIESPSKVMRDSVGKMLVEGMAQGITKNTNVITGAMQKAGEMMTTAFDANVTLVGDAPMNGVQSNTFNNTITVNGAQDPEAWTRGFVRTLNRQARAAMG